MQFLTFLGIFSAHTRVADWTVVCLVWYTRLSILSTRIWYTTFQWYNPRVLVHATCCTVNLRMTHDLSVVQAACAPKIVFFPHFCCFFCCCGIFGRYFGVLCRCMTPGSYCHNFWLFFIYAVILFIGLGFTLFSFTPPPLLGLIFWLMFLVRLC